MEKSRCMHNECRAYARWCLTRDASPNCLHGFQLMRCRIAQTTSHCATVIIIYLAALSSVIERESFAALVESAFAVDPP